MAETEVHEMQGYQEGHTVTWNCPICGRKLAFVYGVPFVLEVGDMSVQHRGWTKMTISTTLTATPAPDPFEQWAEGADFSALDFD